MLPDIFYVSIGLLIASQSLVFFFLKKAEQLFALSLLQLILALPLMAGGYIYFAYSLDVSALGPMLLSEAVLGLVLFSLANRFCQLSNVKCVPGSLLEIAIWLSVSLATVFYIGSGRVEPAYPLPVEGFVYFLNVFLLLAVFYSAWRLEQFWRFLDRSEKDVYRVLVVGCFVALGAFTWACSYRLAFLQVLPSHLLLLGALLIFSWLMIVYSVLRYRLLNRKIFVSRKMVYSFIVPTLLAAYLLGFGLLCIVMRAFGIELSLLVRGLAIALGLSAIALLALSERVRRRVKFFISTHFYINKYEYRDEWLALSRRLQGVTDEKGVARALKEVLEESLYTDTILIWLGDNEQGFRLVEACGKDGLGEKEKWFIPPGDKLVQYLSDHPHLYLKEAGVAKERDLPEITLKGPFSDLQIELVSPLKAGQQLLGFVAIGPEFNQGTYGQDDFDLLAALGSQAASAILACRTSEKLARIRERRVWDRLSAFVLHDIKNAASMLALLKENAPDHIHEPEFQQDMLELIDDALKRMKRVQERLGSMSTRTIRPRPVSMDLTAFLEKWLSAMASRLPSLAVTFEAPGPIPVICDKELLSSILENIILNSLEAGGEKTRVKIRAWLDEDAGKACVEIVDTGPGIPEELLPDLLFAPFKTTKTGGSGVGLWQAKRLVEALKGEIYAENGEEGGARFVLKLPA